MIRPRSLLLCTVLALAASGCTSDGDAEPERPLPTIESARNGDLPVRPGDFCERIDDRAIVAAVGDDAESAHYGNGDRAEISPGVTDVAHEFGCVFTNAAGERAHAWVAVPPVTTGQARRIGPGKGCSRTAEGLGDPGFAATCTSDLGTTAMLAGLYTDTWFGCSLTQPTEAAGTAAAQERLDTWCAAAVQAAATADQ